MAHTPQTERPHPASIGGVQKIYRFANGYGASVVQFRGSYGFEDGLWELAVIKFIDSKTDHFRITYETPLTTDVIGHLSLDEVESTLDQIAALAEVAA